MGNPGKHEAGGRPDKPHRPVGSSQYWHNPGWSKKLSQKTFVVSITAILVLMTAVSADGFFDSNRERRTLDDVVTVDYPENVSNIQIQLFFQQARQAYAEVSEYLGVHVPVSIHIGSHSRLQIDMNYNYKILFPQKYLGHRTPGLWHEMGTIRLTYQPHHVE